MRLRLPPKYAFPHKIAYVKKGGEDDWGKPILGEPVDILNTRVDEGYDFRRGGTNATNDMPNALIVIFAKYNKGLPAFENGNTIQFNGKEFTIVAVIPLYFTSDDIIGYELEVR